MSRHHWAIVALAVLTVPLAPCAAGVAGGPPTLYYHAPGEAPAPAHGLIVLCSNATANLSAYLLAPSIDDLHEGERLNLTLVHRSVHGEAACATIDVEGDGEGGRLPDMCLWGTDPGRRDFTTANCTYGASYFELVLRPRAPLVAARVRCDGDSVALEWNATLLPARVLLSARLVLPGDQTSLPELRRVQASVLVGNGGGLDALDQVVDVRYTGRILTTWNVPLVPSGGSYAVPFAFTPVLGGGEIEAYLVSGEGAPYRIGAMPVDVRAAASLTVDWVEVGRPRVEEGSRLTVTARLTNAGNLTADGMEVQFLVDGGVVANATVHGLAAGASTTVSGAWVATGPGTHAVSARVLGEPFGAEAVPVRVTAKAPGPGPAMAALAVAALAALRRAGRR